MYTSFEQYCKEHFLPKRRIKADNIAEVNPQWKENLKERWWEDQNIKSYQNFLEQGVITGCTTPEETYKQFLFLHNVLLAIGGSETCFPCFEPDMEAILFRGRYFSGKSKMMKGKPCQCHSNSCKLWVKNHEEHDVAICTGYALSADGMWRQHSWLIWRQKDENKETVIETTKKRKAYYGFVMTKDEAIDFISKNI